jgi:hypothetical protein
LLKSPNGNLKIVAIFQFILWYNPCLVKENKVSLDAMDYSMLRRDNIFNFEVKQFPFKQNFSQECWNLPLYKTEIFGFTFPPLEGTGATFVQIIQKDF